jgi:hypothetical protein
VWVTKCEEMVRMIMSSCLTREQKERSGGGCGVECDCREARADATVRWSRSESSEIKEDRSGERLTGTCGRASMTRTAKRRSRS